MKGPSFAKDLLEAVISPPVTLSKLAAGGIFASLPLGLPLGVLSDEIKIYYEGVLTERGVIEVYAPGDETGWAVVHKVDKDGRYVGQIELIWGKWKLLRVNGQGSVKETLDADSRIEEDMYKEYFRGEGYP